MSNRPTPQEHPRVNFWLGAIPALVLLSAVALGAPTPVLAQIRYEDIPTPKSICLAHCEDPTEASDDNRALFGLERGAFWKLFKDDGSRNARRARAVQANDEAVALKGANWARAVVLYQEAVSIDPNDPVFRSNLAIAQRALAAQQEGPRELAAASRMRQ